MSKKITNIAHRGASSYAPENTMAAFDLAIEMGVKHIELDVHCSKDNQLVVIHDDTLDRPLTAKEKLKISLCKNCKPWTLVPGSVKNFQMKRYPPWKKLSQNM